MSAAHRRWAGARRISSASSTADLHACRAQRERRRNAAPVGDASWDFSRRHRVKIDSEHHSAVKDHRVVGEQAWAREARFTVTKLGMIPRKPQGGTMSEAAHASVLRCAAAGA